MELSPVKTTLRIALVGDFNPDVIAHQRSRWRLTTPLRFWISPLIMTGSPRLS